MFTNHDLSGLPDPEYDPQFYEGVAVKRLLAWVADVVIVTVLVGAVFIFTLGLAAFAFFPAIFMINLGYRWFFLSKKSATLGMQMFGIEIRNGRGERLDSAESFWHSLFFVMLFFFLLLPVLANIIMMLVSERGQGLHDYFLGTTAINRPA